MLLLLKQSKGNETFFATEMTVDLVGLMLCVCVVSFFFFFGLLETDKKRFGFCCLSLLVDLILMGEDKEHLFLQQRRSWGRCYCGCA